MTEAGFQDTPKCGQTWVSSIFFLLGPLFSVTGHCFSASGSLPFFLIYPCCSDSFCFVTCASPWTLNLKSLLSWTKNISIGPIIQLEAKSCTLWHLFLFLLLHIQFTKFYKCCLLLVTSSLTLECPFLLFTLRYLTGLPDLTVRDLYKKTQSQLWWLVPVTPALRKLRHENCCEFKISLDYTVNSKLLSSEF